MESLYPVPIFLNANIQKNILKKPEPSASTVKKGMLSSKEPARIESSLAAPVTLTVNGLPGESLLLIKILFIFVVEFWLFVC